MRIRRPTTPPSSTNGTVDVDGTGFVHNEMPGNGHYVDLDGSTMHAGVFSNSFTAGAWGLYTLSFDIAGNQRNWGTDTVEVTFAAGMDHPLRLTSPEATGILVALRALLDVPGMVDPGTGRVIHVSKSKPTEPQQP